MMTRTGRVAVDIKIETQILGLVIRSSEDWRHGIVNSPSDRQSCGHCIVLIARLTNHGVEPFDLDVAFSHVLEHKADLQSAIVMYHGKSCRQKSTSERPCRPVSIHHFSRCLFEFKASRYGQVKTPLSAVNVS